MPDNDAQPPLPGSRRVAEHLAASVGSPAQRIGDQIAASLTLPSQRIMEQAFASMTVPSQRIAERIVARTEVQLQSRRISEQLAANIDLPSQRLAESLAASLALPSQRIMADFAASVTLPSQQLAQQLVASIEAPSRRISEQLANAAQRYEWMNRQVAIHSVREVTRLDALQDATPSDDKAESALPATENLLEEYDLEEQDLQDLEGLDFDAIFDGLLEELTDEGPNDGRDGPRGLNLTTRAATVVGTAVSVNLIVLVHALWLFYPDLLGPVLQSAAIIDGCVLLGTYIAGRLTRDS